MKRARVFLSVMLVLLLSACGSGQVSSRNEDASSTMEQQAVSYASWEDVPASEYEREIVTVDCDGQTIWGVAYVPKLDKERYPLVVCAHGLGGSYKSCVGYARLMASHGIAAYCFEFRCGGKHSDGDTTDMTLMTEVADVQAVVAAARQWDFVDPGRVVLLGKSHGGAASAVAAARNPGDVYGLILFYPGFMLRDAIHEMYGSLDEVPDTFVFKGHEVGKAYAEAVWDYDVYGEIGNYAKPVLLMHGNKDKVVPVSHSDRAAQVYPDVDYFVIDGAGHGFTGERNEEAQQHVLDYLNRIGIFR